MHRLAVPVGSCPAVLSLAHAHHHTANQPTNQPKPAKTNQPSQLNQSTNHQTNQPSTNRPTTHQTTTN